MTCRGESLGAPPGFVYLRKDLVSARHIERVVPMPRNGGVRVYFVENVVDYEGLEVVDVAERIYQALLRTR